VDGRRLGRAAVEGQALGRPLLGRGVIRRAGQSIEGS
jgi:hypothetical protein